MISIALQNRDNFYARRLTGDHRRLYEACVDNLSRGVFRTTVTLESQSAEEMSAGMEEVLEAVLVGCPELFFVDQGVETACGGNSVTLTFKNKYGGENVSEMNDRLNGEIDRISGIIGAIPDTFGKIHRLNRYLCARVRPNSSIESRFGDAYGALILREARCEGFAKAAKLILNRVGIESVIASGKAEGDDGTREDHSWNVIAMDGNYYHCDFTWNAGGSYAGIPGQEYMFLDDQMIMKNHFPEYAFPACTDGSKTFWARNKGFVRYHSDLSRIKIVPFKNNYLAIAQYAEPLDPDEVNDSAITWMRDELAASSYGADYSYRFNEKLNLLVFFFINQQ